MRDYRRIPLPPDEWRFAVVGGEGSPLVGEDHLGAPPFSTASIHAVLSRAGIEQPWRGERAELDSEWVGRTEWGIFALVDVPPLDDGAHCALVIDTIDGTCDVALGCVPLGTHASEHVPFEARVPDALRGKRLPLTLAFRAPVSEVLRWQSQLGERPVNGDWTPFSFARSAACGFGWDWGPRVPGVGFYGARFDCWNSVRVTGVTVAQRWNDDGTVAVTVRAQGDFPAGSVECVVRERANPRHLACDAEGRVTLRPTRLWSTWDRGGGEGSWWHAIAGVRDESGAFRAVATTRFALRRIELDTAEDAVGRRFRFLLNGEPLYARGANLIPPLLGARHEHDWLSEMRRYRETGFNMVRVWGGGNYLPDAFYEACDELGILVWQDFMFACATYPEDEPFATLVAREASHQVQRLSRHPSLAIWCGGNEDILAWWSWGWKDRLKPGQSWGLSYWTKTLPDAVAAHDPGTPYWTESPYSGSMELHPNDPDHGDRHTWDAEAKIEDYRRVLPRFSSEFGHQSPPCWRTIVEDCLDPARDASSMTPAELVTALSLRQKAWGGDACQYAPFLKSRFREARSAREYVAQAQHLQARAMDVAMRWLRAGMPRSMGALIWQWNDVWAGHSWSLVDVAGRAKPAWHAVRKACAPRLLAIEPLGDFEQWKGGLLEVVLSDFAWLAEPTAPEPSRASIERVGFDGTVHGRAEVALLPHSECGLPAATLRARVPEALVATLDRSREVLVARVLHEPSLAPAVWFLAPDAELALPPAAFDRVDSARCLARTLIRELWIEEAGVDCASGWRTVLAGEEFELREGDSWWCANSFAAGAGCA